MTWFLLAICSVFALALGELMQQHLLHFKNQFSERTSAVLTFLFQSLLTAPVILFSPLRSQLFALFQPGLFPRVLIVTFIASIAMIFYLRSFKVKNISISAIFVSFSTVISTSLGIIFFHESLDPPKFLGIGLILGAIISLNLKNIHLEKNHFYGLLAGIMFGVTYSLDKSILITGIHPLIYVFWAFMLVPVFGFLFSIKEVITNLQGKKLTDFKSIYISGFGYFIYNLCTFFAYRLGGEVGRIDAINNSQIFLIILFEYFILKHQDALLRKIVTAAIAYTGVVILGLT